MIRKLCAALLLLTVPAFTTLAIAGDTLEEVKKKGVLVAGVKDSTLPFGFADQKTGEIIGYDVDFVHAIAKQLGVKLELRPVTSANRIPELIEGNIDIIAATMLSSGRVQDGLRRSEVGRVAQHRYVLCRTGVAGAEYIRRQAESVVKKQLVVGEVQ